MRAAYMTRVAALLLGGTNLIFLSTVVLAYVQAAVGLLISVTLARALGPVNYGVFAYGLVVGGFVSVFVCFGSDKTLVRDLLQSANPAATLSASALTRGLLAALAVIAVTAGFCINHRGESDVFFTVILCTAAAIAQGLQPTAWYDARYEMHVHAAISLADKIAFCTIIIVLGTALTTVPLTSTIVAACLMATACLACVWQWVYVAKSFRFQLRGYQIEAARMAAANIPVFGAALAALLLTHANQLLILRDHDSACLGCYAVALQMASATQIFLAQLARFVAPKIARVTAPGGPAARMARCLGIYCAIAFLAAACLTIPLAGLGPYLIGRLFGTAYEPAVPALRVLCAWCLIYGPALIINKFLLFFSFNKSYLLVTLMAGLLAIYLGQCWVARDGAVGAAWALLAAHSASILLQLGMVITRILCVRCRERPFVADGPV